MGLSLTYLDDLSRVRLDATDVAGDAAIVERSTDQVRWSPVRGGLPVTVTGGAFRLDDYEFSPNVANYYRVRPADPAVELPVSGQITTAGTGTSHDQDWTVPAFSIAGRMIRLTLTVDNVDRIDDLNLFIATSPTLSSNIRWRFDADTASSRIGKSGEPFQIDLKLAEINSTAGSISLSPVGVPSVVDGFTTLRLRVSDDTTGPITVTLHSAQLVPMGSPKGFVSITFDDNHSSVMGLARPKMASLGFRGTHYTIVDAVGGPDRVTLADLETLAGDGWEIAGHSYAEAVHDARYTGVTAAQARADLAALHEWLQEHFPRPEGRQSFAYPGGNYENTLDGVAVERLVREAGFASGRTILASVGIPTHLQIAGVPEVMPYRIHAASSISELSTGQQNPDTLTATGGMLDKTASNGGWLILVFHRVVAGAASTTSEISQADFDMIMDAIAARDLTVVTTGEGLDTLHGVIEPTLSTLWLKSPLRPFLNRPVRLHDFSEVTRAARQGVFQPVGRSVSIAVTDVRGPRQQTVYLRTDTDSERRTMDAVLASGQIMLLHCPPGCPVDSMYAAIGDTTEARTSYRYTRRRVFALPLIEVAPPHPSMPAATITWQGVLNRYATWADVLAAHPTWQSLLEDVGDVEDVFVP